MNDDDLKYIVLNLIEKHRFEKLEFVYKLNGNFLWVYSDKNGVRGFKNFSLRNLDILLKFLKRKNIEFNKFDVQY